MREKEKKEKSEEIEEIKEIEEKETDDFEIIEKSSKNSIFPMLIILVGILFLIALGFTLLSKDDQRAEGTVSVAEEQSSEAQESGSEPHNEQTAAKKTVKMNISLADIYSTAVYLADKDGNVIFEENSDDRLSPASLTKIMTALVAIESVRDLDEKVKIPSSIYTYIAEQQASTAGFSPEETVTYRDLIYGAMLPSGAECCLTLAIKLARSEEQYVAIMNQKARDIGMNSTRFVNVCGLHSSDHYSTAKDISILLNYALKNKTFREVFTTESYDTITDMHPSGITLDSTMFSAMSSEKFRGGKIMGGKTGYTNEAGLCLASLAEIGGEEYTLVTMGADGSHATAPYHILDAKKIYETLANGGEQLPEEPTEPTEPVQIEPDYVPTYDGVYNSEYDNYTEPPTEEEPYDEPDESSSEPDVSTPDEPDVTEPEPVTDPPADPPTEATDAPTEPEAPPSEAVAEPAETE